MTRQPLVIGIGQPLRGADGAGWQIAECYEALHGGQAKVVKVIQLTPELSEMLSDHSAVAFVDARVDRLRESILLDPLSEMTDDVAALSHVTSPSELLAYARGVFGYAPRAILVTAPVRESDLTIGGSPLDPELVNEAADKIRQWFEAV